MLLIAGLFALLAGAQAGGPAPQTVSQEDHQRTVRQLQDTRRQKTELQTFLNTSRLQQMAMIIHFTSRNGSRLALGSGVSANPRLGRIPRAMGQGSSPFITVYPASSPFKATLNGVGDCELLGAVNLLEGARNHGEKTHCEAGIYLLALRSPAKGVMSLSLLDAQVDMRGEMQYKEVLKVPAAEQKVAVPAVTVAFPGPNEASAEQPAWHVTIEMPAHDLRVRFGFDMDIMML